MRPNLAAIAKWIPQSRLNSRSSCLRQGFRVLRQIPIGAAGDPAAHDAETWQKATMKGGYGRERCHTVGCRLDTVRIDRDCTRQGVWSAYRPWHPYTA